MSCAGNDSQGLATIFAHRAEMGQGVRTSVPMIVADKLEAEWSRVVVEQAAGDKKYGNQYTDGSRSIRHNYQRMREFGAVARTMLEQAAAKQWGVDAGECKAKNHQVVHVPSGKTLDYGALVATAARLPVPDAKQVRLKASTEFRYIGKDLPIVDLPDVMLTMAYHTVTRYAWRVACFFFLRGFVLWLSPAVAWQHSSNTPVRMVSPWPKATFSGSL